MYAFIDHFFLVKKKKTENLIPSPAAQVKWLCLNIGYLQTPWLMNIFRQTQVSYQVGFIPISYVSIYIYVYIYIYIDTYIYIIIYPIIVNLNKFSQNSLVKSLPFLDKSQICCINAFVCIGFRSPYLYNL